jgi:phosphatidylglycerol---prolipoprotein diacylglyceryl transferase
VLAVITIAFNPLLRLSETSSVRYETIVLAIVLLIGLVTTAWIGARTPGNATDEDVPGLRIDDLVFISVGSVPGLIVGGRLGYVLDHLDFYAGNPQAILDAAQGGLTLTLAVPLGILTAAMIARLLGAPVGRWLHVAALPMLFVLAAGKLAGVLGATGQGAASDLEWATAYSGPGPWGSLAAELPAHPSQLYEAIAIAVAVVVLAVASRHRSIARPTGASLFLALGLWALARFVVAFTWRDPATLGPLRVDQVLLIVVAVAAVAGVIERARWAQRDATELTRTGLDARPA